MTAPRLTSRLFLRIDPLTHDRLNALANDDSRTASAVVRRLVTAAFVDTAAAHAADPSHDLASCPLCKLATLAPEYTP